MSGTLTDRLDAATSASRVDAASVDSRVTTNLHALVRLRSKARGFTFLPKQPTASLLSGRHASHIRGRGLNFEEIRRYHAGDDIRTIDWKVTARLRSPHTRVFTEERDRPTLVVVDSRIGMFFGTQHNMKSVTTAEAAALAAWRTIDVGDRMGMIIFDDENAQALPLARSRDGVMRMLRTIVDFNGRLSAASPVRSNASMLGVALDQAARVATHDHLVIVISDFHGLDDAARQRLRKLRSHNDVIAALVHDPSASKLPPASRITVSDGDMQLELPDSDRIRKRLLDATAGRIRDVLSLQKNLRIPVIPISAGEETAAQIQHWLGR
ncbi:hypothetical protein Poly51_13570 [Rubripirellula tenax]|uniref:DUF58 domain-containing protein n=1 Tax=Rubripirellula tenax TaxID=2528015 RepID=A0A5C6FAY8_9BACT|nr:DUF58 domain-containing protein [Rubripirellula tenax]TWU58578.1 hypothetical protein Poly51_13570 [Rubripirellula tenax]